MPARKVTVIGNYLENPPVMMLPASPTRAKVLTQIYNYTRVVTADGGFADHVAWLKARRNLPRETPFTVWEMFLCGGLLLSSHLARNGVEVQLVNYIDADNEAGKLAEIHAFAPDIIAVTTTFVLTKRHMHTIGDRLRREFPETFLLAGGHHIFTTLMYMSPDEQADYLRETRFDAFIEDSQGEAALLRLVQSYPDDFAGIPNLLWRRGDEVVRNLRLPEENDINKTPIDFDLVPPGSLAHIRTARSCSFKCAFCSYPSIAGDLASMEIPLAIETLRKAKAAGIAGIFFTDDTFNVPKDRFEHLLDAIIEADLCLPWYSFIRCQYLDEALVAKMKRSGCRGVYLGVESGSNKILKNMKKGAIAGFYRDGIRWLKEAGLITVGSFVLGFPGETAETVEETRRFIEGSGLDFYYVQPFYYLHHAPVHLRADEFKLTGEGMYWQHETMTSSTAADHVARLFLEIESCRFVNPDYTLWEIAYLLHKGMTLDDIRAYRDEVNLMTRRQMGDYTRSLSQMATRQPVRMAADSSG